MRINGTAELTAPPTRVFEALNDPAVLAATIPGVQALDRVGQDRYRMTITAGVASVKGSYTGEVSLSDHQPPHAFTLRGTGSGAPGTVDATVRVVLAESARGTLLEYDADAVVGGMVGGVGQRMLASVARRMAGQFFGAVERVIADGLPTAPATVPGPRTAADDTLDDAAPLTAPATPADATSPPRPYDEDRVPFWVVLAGVGAGAFWALAGVAVGYAVARGQQRGGEWR